MRINGNLIFEVPKDRVWAALNDHHVWRVITPGCERLEPQGNDQYALTVKVGVAAIKGTFTGTIEVIEKQEADSMLMRVNLNGSAGWVKMEGKVNLTEETAGAVLNYDWDAKLGGTVAAVGQRVLGGVAKMLIDQMFSKLKTVLGSNM